MGASPCGLCLGLVHMKKDATMRSTDVIIKAALLGSTFLSACDAAEPQSRPMITGDSDRIEGEFDRETDRIWDNAAYLDYRCSGVMVGNYLFTAGHCADNRVQFALGGPRFESNNYATLRAKSFTLDDGNLLDFAIFAPDRVREVNRHTIHLGDPRKLSAGEKVLILGSGNDSCPPMGGREYLRNRAEGKHILRAAIFTVTAPKIFGFGTELRGIDPSVATCSGDSGAPVFALQEGEARLVGLISGRSHVDKGEGNKMEEDDIKAESMMMRLDHPKICAALASTELAPQATFCQ